MFAFVARPLTSTRMSSLGTPKYRFRVHRTSATSFTQPLRGGTSDRSYASTPTKTDLILATPYSPRRLKQLSHPGRAASTGVRLLDTQGGQGYPIVWHVLPELRIREPSRVPVLRLLRRSAPGGRGSPAGRRAQDRLGPLL